MAKISKYRLILSMGVAMALVTTGAFAQLAVLSADKILYDRGIEKIESGDYATARLTLNTLINGYPASEFQAKAKLAIAISWLREGGPHGLAQAEAEYKDFYSVLSGHEGNRRPAGRRAIAKDPGTTSECPSLAPFGISARRACAEYIRFPANASVIRCACARTGCRSSIR
jgi:hypothetical protein